MSYPGAYASLVIGCFLDLFKCRMWVRRRPCPGNCSYPRWHCAPGRVDRGLHGSRSLDSGVPRRPRNSPAGIYLAGWLQHGLPLDNRRFFPAYSPGHFYWGIIALAGMPSLRKFDTRTGLSSRTAGPGSARAVPQFRTAVAGESFVLYFVPLMASPAPPSHVILSEAEGSKLLACNQHSSGNPRCQLGIMGLETGGGSQGIFGESPNPSPAPRCACSNELPMEYGEHFTRGTVVSRVPLALWSGLLEVTSGNRLLLIENIGQLDNRGLLRRADEGHARRISYVGNTTQSLLAAVGNLIAVYGNWVA